MNSTKVICLYGGPGCGKSTLAAELFYILKRCGASVELVREYVKDWAWQNRKVGLYDQLYIAGKQSSKEVGLYGKVDFIVTDSPMLLGPFYQHYYSGKASYVLPAVRGLMEDAERNGIKYYHFLLSRNKPYVAAGRYETEEEAKNIDANIQRFLQEVGVDYTQITMPDEMKAASILAYFGV